MSTVNSLTGVNQAGATQVDRKTGGGLDKDAFMRLLVENLRHQDPTQPQDGQQFFAQMSQMTMLEQVTNLAGSAAESAKEDKAARAAALVGRTVSWTAADGTPRTGVVESAQTGGDAPTLTVGGVAGIDPAKLTEVR